MSRAHTILATLSFVFMMLPAAHAGQPWTDEAPTAALARAKREAKPAIVDFFAVWCGPCKEMDKATYPDPQVRELMNGFVSIRIDVEKGEGVDLAKQFKIFNYPTVVFVGADGEEIDRHVGLLTPAEFIATATATMAGKGTLKDLLQKVADKPDDLDLWLRIGDKYGEHQDVRSAERYLGRVIRRSLGVPAAAERAQEAVMALAHAYRRAEQHAEMAAVLEDFVYLFADTAAQDQAISLLASAYYKTERKEEAVRLYTDWLGKKGMDDPDALNSYAWFFAKRQYNLQQAIAFGKRAVELSQRQPGVIDTLAEAHFAAGNYDEAIALMRECIAADAEDVYFKEQLDKFEKAKAASGKTDAGSAASGV
ncbi:MAG: thioredoxin family protein [Candidatus Schekmanbacteria bacterium]|nr:thioredoxin family protein [Candidatus Schekmanbacteria bacterium]